MSFGFNGYIFGCTDATEQECRHRKLFGLPAKHRNDVLALQPNTPLFLFNYDRRVLYGVFTAASQGGWNIDPSAWGGQFPSQIRVQDIEKHAKKGETIPERQFRPILSSNYFDRTRFTYHLSPAQVTQLVRIACGSEINSERLNRPRGNKKHLQPPRVISLKPKRPVLMKRRAKKPPVLKLVPGRPVPIKNCAQRRFKLFEKLKGYKVTVDERFPVSHYPSPSREKLLTFGSRPLEITRQPSDDRMEVELEEVALSKAAQILHRPVDRRLLPFNRQTVPAVGRLTGLPMVSTPSPLPSLPPVYPRPDYSVSLNRPPQRNFALPQKEWTRPKLQEESWRLGEWRWDNAEAFKAFVTGKGSPPLPTQPSFSLPVTSKALVELPEVVVPVEEDQKRESGPVIEEVIEEGEIVDLGSSEDDSEIECLGEVAGFAAPLEKKVVMLKDSLARNFGVIDCDVAMKVISSEHHVPGSAGNHYGVELCNKCDK